jgi:hypothetical protein
MTVEIFAVLVLLSTQQNRARTKAQAAILCIAFSTVKRTLTLVHEREIGLLVSSKTTELASVTESARRLRRCVSMELNGRIRTSTCSGGNDDDDHDHDDHGWC